MLSQPIQLAMFDMAGTTVNDKVGGCPLMVISMMRAFAKHGIELSPDVINKHRGKQKSEAIQTLLREVAELSPAEVEHVGDGVYREFLRELESNLSRISEIDGTTELFRHLKSKDIHIGVGSGFPTAGCSGNYLPTGLAGQGAARLCRERRAGWCRASQPEG